MHAYNAALQVSLSQVDVSLLACATRSRFLLASSFVRLSAPRESPQSWHVSATASYFLPTLFMYFDRCFSALSHEFCSSLSLRGSGVGNAASSPCHESTKQSGKSPDKHSAGFANYLDSHRTEQKGVDLAMRLMHSLQGSLVCVSRFSPNPPGRPHRSLRIAKTRPCARQSFDPVRLPSLND